MSAGGLGVACTSHLLGTMIRVIIVRDMLLFFNKLFQQFQLNEADAGLGLPQHLQIRLQSAYLQF